MVAEARTRGLEVCIYRPGRVTGHSRTGASNDGDLFSRILKFCIQTGKIPRLNASLMTDIVPVDYVSQALVLLSMREDSVDHAFHLVHPCPIEWRDLFRLIVDLGHPIEEVPFSEWLAARDRYGEEHDDPILPALDFSPLLRTDESILRTPDFDSSNTLGRLAGTPVVCPPVDGALLNTYLSRWMQSGHLRPPGTLAAREPR